MTSFRTRIVPLAVLLLLLAGVLPADAGRTSCPSHYFQGLPPDITNPKMLHESRELCLEGFGVMHSGITRTPLWSAEHLTREGVASAGRMVRTNSFHAEERLPPGERAELRDYSRSGYDRGHMAPNGDMPARASQYDSFSLANIVPQDADSNRGVWQRIESSVRAFAKKRGELYVITGPLFRGARLSRIGGRVMVPSHVYKIVLDPGSGKGAAYIVENAPTTGYDTVTIAELEAIAGIDFFPGMPVPAKKEKLELPKPARKGGSRSKRPPQGSGADALLRELETMFR